VTSSTHLQPDTDEPREDPEVLAQRARAYQGSHDARVLWPELELSLLQPAADAIGKAVASRLDGRPATLGAAGGHDAYAIGIASHLAGVGPLLGQWIERGALDVSEAVAAVLARHLSHGRRRVMRIADGLTPALARLLDAQITPTIIKGFHTAHVYFDEPGLRPLADVDVVVPPDEIARAEAALREAAFAPSLRIERPYKREWYPSDDDDRLRSLELFHAHDRWKLELHEAADFALLPRYGFRLDVGVRTEKWIASGMPVRVPAQPLLTAMLAIHLSAELYTRRLLRLVELVFVIRRDRESGLFEWGDFEALLDECGARRFVYPALSLVEQLAPGTVDAAVLERCRRGATRLTRQVVEGCSPARPILHDTFSIAERLMWIANPRDLLVRVVDWVTRVMRGSMSWLPSREKH
jgi:hypothetical protein